MDFTFALVFNGEFNSVETFNFVFEWHLPTS